MKKQNKRWILALMALVICLIMTFIPKMLEATVYAKISGRVTKEDTGEGLKGVLVFLYRGPDFSERSRRLTEVYTDDRGEYKIDMLIGGTYALLFFAPGESGYYLDTIANKKALLERTISVQKGQHVEVNRKALISGAFRAVVKKRDGTKVVTEEGGLDIGLYDQIGNDYRVPEDLKRPGEYFSMFPPGIYRCEAKTWTSWGYPTQKVENIVIEKGKTTFHEFIMDPSDPTGIEGRVLDPDGNPIPDERMAVYDEKTDKELCIFFTDLNGHYSVVGLSPGAYRLWCEANWRLGKLGTYKGIIVNPGKRTWYEIRLGTKKEPTTAISAIQSPINTYQDDSIITVRNLSGPSSQGMTNFVEGRNFFFENSESISLNIEYDYRDYNFPKAYRGLYVYPNLDSEVPDEEYEKYTQFLDAFIGALEKGKNGNCLLPAKYHKIISDKLNSPRYQFAVFLMNAGSMGGACGSVPAEYQFAKIKHLNYYILPLPQDNNTPCGCLESVIFHELLHLLVTSYAECATYACTKDCYPCAMDQPEYEKESGHYTIFGEQVRGERCWEKDKNGEYKWRTDCSGKKVPGPLPPSSDQNARPDNDHGDDNYSSASPRAVEGLVESLNPEVLVLKHGFWQEAGAFINTLGKRFSYIEPDQSPLEMANPPLVLIIPSGGLYGLDNSPQLRTILQDFVSRGGTVIVSSQQRGYEFKALPGGEEIEAQGWREDISCFWESTFIDWWHPVFSRITDAKISIPIDGYFTRVPDGSTVLLSRSEGTFGRGAGNPELFYYSWGEGTVVASSSYEDYADWISGSPEKRRAVFRDLLTWALAPRVPIPEYNLRENASPTVNLNVEVENRSEEPASSAKMIWLTPNRRVVYEEEKLISLPAGGKIEIPLSYSFSNIPEADYGIWHVDYLLYGPDDQEIQSQREAATGRFSVCLPSEEFIDAYKLFVEIQPEQMQMLAGTSAKYKVRIVNRAAEAKKLRLYWSWWLIPPATYWEEVEVPAGGSLIREITVNSSHLCVHVFEENGLKPYHSLINAKSLASQDPWPYVGSKQGREIRVVYPLVEASIQAEKSYYRKGEEVKIRSIIRNKIAFSYPVDYEIKVWGNDINGRTKTFYYDQGQVEMEADGVTVFEKTFVPAAEAGNGVYFIYFYITHDLWKWRQNKSLFVANSFHIADSGVIVSPRIPDQFVYGAASDVAFDLKCGGKFPADNGTLTLRLVSAQNKELFRETKPVSMVVGETKTVAFSVPMTGLKFGVNRLEYTYSDETGCQFFGTKPVEYRFYRPSATFDRSSYQMGETARLHFVWSGSGQVESDLGIEVAVPETGFVQTTQAHYTPGSTGGAIDVDIPVTANLLSTRPEVLVTCLSPSGERSATKLNLVVAQPNITLTPRYDKSFYRIRETLSLTLEVEGKGGFIIPLPSQLRVEIPSLNYDSLQVVTVAPGGKVDVPVSLAIPATLAAGPYDVKTTLTLPNGSGVVGQSQFTIRAATWEVTPEKNEYAAGETINLKIQNTGGVDGTASYRLNLEGKQGEEVAFKDGSASIQAGAEMSETLAIPDQAVSGEYQLFLTISDQTSGAERTLAHSLQILGLVSSLEVRTDKDKYFTSEEIGSLGKILNGNREITDGTLEMKVMRLTKSRGWQPYYNTGFARDNNIFRLAFDKNSNPVVSTNRGVFRFNGLQWEFLSQWQLNYKDLVVDNSDKIWLVASSSLTYSFYYLYVYSGTSWKRYTTADGLGSAYVYSVTEDGAGNIWLGTGNGISNFDGTKFTNYKQENGCPFQLVQAINVDQSGVVWIGSSSGAARFDGTAWTVYTTSNSGLPDNNVFAIAVDRDGHVWFGTSSGLTEFDGSSWTSFSSEDAGFDISSNFFSHLAFDADNNLWLVSSSSELIEYDASVWRRLGALDGLNSSVIRDVAISPDGSVWAATDHGLSRQREAGWSPLFIDLKTNGLIDNPEALIIDSNNNIWIGTPSGLEKFDGENWTVYLSVGNEVVGGITSLALGANDVLWLATDRGLKKFDRVSWTTYPYPEKLQTQWDLISSIAVDLSGRVWVDNGRVKAGLWVFDGTNWREFSSVDGLPEDSVQRLAVDKQGRIWAGTRTAGVGVYDGTSWVVYDTSNGLSDNFISSIFIDSRGAVWVGTNDGLNRYDGQSWQIFTKADGLPGNRIFSIDEDSYGTIWVLNIDWEGDVIYLSRYDGKGWGSNMVLGSRDAVYYDLLVVDNNDSLWINNPYEKLVRIGDVFWQENTVWTSGLAINQAAGSTVDYETEVGSLYDPGKYILRGTLYSATGQEIAAASYPFQVFIGDVCLSLGAEKRYYKKGEEVVISGEAVNGSEQDEADLTLKIYRHFNNEPEELVFQDSFPLTAKASRPWSFTQSEEREGIVVLRGELLRQQTVAFSAESGYEVITPTLEAEVDAPSVVGNDPFDLKVKLANRGKIDGAVSVRIPSLGFEQNISLLPGEMKMLSVQAQMSATTEYVVEFTGDLESQVRKTVVYGYAASVEFPAPLIYPKGVVTLPATITNTGSLDLSFEVNYELYAAANPILLASLKRGYSLPAQNSLLDSLPFSLAAGEYVLKYASPLAQGQVLIGVVDPGAGRLTLQPQSVYAQGLVTMPLTLLNEAAYAGDIDLTFKVLRGQEEVFTSLGSYYLSPGEARSDSISFSAEAEGEYTFLVQGAKLAPVPPVAFRVVPLEKLEPVVTFEAPSGGALPLSVRLENTGYNDFQGFVEVRSDFYSSQQAVSVPAGQTQNIDMTLSLASGAAGEHQVSVVLVSAAGQETVLETKPIKIETADIVISELPSGQNFTAGEQASLTFKLRNQGNLEGEAAFGLKVMDILNETRIFVVSPGAEEEVTFSFEIPGDLAGQDYSAFYKLEGTGAKAVKEGDLRFSVQGIAVDVGAQLDKPSYREGETARLTLTVTNRNQTPVELFAKVGYLDYEGEQSFTLETSTTLDFLIPLPQISEGKVFYGIYHRDGRGVHLNDIYIYKKGEGADVEMDRQVYEPGSNVLMAITTPKAGLMRISGPGYEEEFAVEGSAGRSFALPPDLQAGTYFLSWEFTPADGSGTESSTEMFDVAGLKVVVTEASLSKAKYTPGETVAAAIVFESNRNVTATLKMWVVDPEGRDAEAVSRPVTLSAAEHTIVQESFSFATEYAGMHSLVYGLYDASNQLLVSGSEAFDCGGAVVLAVSTEKSEYPLAAEEVKTRVQLYGDGQANLVFFINGEPVKTVGAELSGVTTEEVTLEPSLLKPGHLTLRVELQRDNLVSRKETNFTYGSALPDLMFESLVSSRNILAYTIKAEVSNQGQTAAGPTAVSFYEGDPAQGGQLIAERPLAGLAAGESAQVEISWSGQAKSGAREIWAVVDQAKAVKEFNEDNNTASLSLDIPEIVHELKLDKTAFSAFEDMTMVTLIANNRETPVQGQWKLKIMNLASGAAVWESEGEVAAIAPYGQSLSSHVFNWGSNPEGEYRVSQILTLDGTAFEDGAVVTVLKTEKVTAAFTLDPAKINPNRDENVNVELDLQNRGNVGIENGILNLEILKKETGQKADEKQWEFNLGIAESRKETKLIALNLAEGFYTVRLLYKGEVLDEKELEAKVQISYTKQESLAPRVLVLANPLSLIEGPPGNEERKKIYKERVLIEEALRNAGLFYKLETNPLLQIRELRSGKYNLTILVDIGPILPQVTQEIKERAWNGEGVIAILSLGLWPEFTEELFGLKVQGVRRNLVETIRTYTTPISQEGTFSLKSDFLNLKAVDPSLILVGTKESDQKPAIALRTYGEGRAVAFGFNLTAGPGEPAYAALQNLLVESIRYLQPRQGNTGTITRLIPVELTFQNPTSSAVRLKIVEELPANVKLVSVEPEPDNQEALTWTFTLEPSGFKYLKYTVELPDLAGSYELKTRIVKIEGDRESPIDTVTLTYAVEKTIRETLLETMTRLQQLPVSTPADREAVRVAAAKLTAVLNRDETRPFAYHMNLWNVLVALGQVEKIRTAETGLVRKRLIELMLAYERKTVEAEWALKIGFIIDLINLL